MCTCLKSSFKSREHSFGKMSFNWDIMINFHWMTCICILNLAKHSVLYFCWEILRRVMQWSEIRKKTHENLSNFTPVLNSSIWQESAVPGMSARAHWLWSVAIIPLSTRDGVRRSMRSIKKDCWALGVVVRGSAGSFFLDVPGQREGVWPV